MEPDAAGPGAWSCGRRPTEGSLLLDKGLGTKLCRGPVGSHWEPGLSPVTSSPSGPGGRRRLWVTLRHFAHKLQGHAGTDPGEQGCPPADSCDRHPSPGSTTLENVRDKGMGEQVPLTSVSNAVICLRGSWQRMMFQPEDGGGWGGWEEGSTESCVSQSEISCYLISVSSSCGPDRKANPRSAC